MFVRFMLLVIPWALVVTLGTTLRMNSSTTTDDNDKRNDLPSAIHHHSATTERHLGYADDKDEVAYSIALELKHWGTEADFSCPGGSFESYVKARFVEHATRYLKLMDVDVTESDWLQNARMSIPLPFHENMVRRRRLSVSMVMTFFSSCPSTLCSATYVKAIEETGETAKRDDYDDLVIENFEDMVNEQRKLEKYVGDKLLADIEDNCGVDMDGVAVKYDGHVMLKNLYSKKCLDCPVFWLY